MGVFTGPKIVNTVGLSLNFLKLTPYFCDHIQWTPEIVNYQIVNSQIVSLQIINPKIVNYELPNCKPQIVNPKF